MELKKRDCPIEIKILPQGAGWTDISWFVPEEMSEPLFLTASYIGCNMSDFARALYYLYPNQFEEGRAGDLIETTQSQIKAEFHFEEEPGGSDWVISRELSAEDNEDNNKFDFPVHVSIKLDKYCGGQFSREFDWASKFDFDVKYNDLCYAVGKAMTDVMKQRGLYGYWYSVSDQIDVVHLLFLKAVALGNTEACKLMKYGQDEGEQTDFAKEMELLLFDM